MPTEEEGLTDHNGELVEEFSLRLANLGFQRMADEITTMLDSGVWRSWKDGLGHVTLLDGEFDYFLSMCGITRDDIMHGIRDMGAKARLETAMDERRGGEEGYRRRYPDVRSAVGPHRKPEPFGLTKAEAKALVETRGGDATNGTTTKPSERRSPLEQAQAAISRLNDDDFAQLWEWLREQRRTRAKA
jgi:hypothetical protein